MEIKSAGDKDLLVEFEDKIDPDVNDKVHALYDSLKTEEVEGIEECIPTYRSLLISYDPVKVEFNELKDFLYDLSIEVENKDISNIQHRIIEVPTIYGGEYGPDLEDVAEINGLSVDKVVDIHSGRRYRVYMMGFTPGFPYLGGMSEKISTPRLEDPRKVIPAGSVGIGDNQTGIYPIESPGGWRLIGRTPISLYTPKKRPPVAFRPGDLVEFVSIDRNEFDEISSRVESGDFSLKVRRS